MRTKILSLLLALLAISNFSFAQNKHFIHSVPFRKATQKMYGEDGSNLVFQPEKDRGLPSAKNLVTFSETDLCKGITVKLGMLMDDTKKSHFLRGMGKKSSWVTNDYIWVFVLDNLDAVCEAKDIGKLKIKDGKKFYFDNKISIHKGFGAVERLSQLLGIDKFPEHVWLCEFQVTVNSSNIFRPAYQPDVTKNDMNKENDMLFLNGKWHLAKKYLSNIEINKTGSIKYLLPEQWLASLQRSKEYPWTRMGYTYDWGDTDHVGVSEFILVPNTELLNVEFYEILK